MGYEAEDLIGEFDGITYSDVTPFLYPDDRELEQVGVRGIYLNNFIRWDSRTQHEKMILEYGYESALQTRTFDTYNHVDCWNYSDVHDYIKYVKYGYGKVVDHACREIRLGHMTREQGIELLEQYLHRKPTNLKRFLDWLGITENAFYYIIDQHRNPKIWQRNEEWEWVRVSKIREELARSGDPAFALRETKPFSQFWITPVGQSTDPKDKYILVGKGVS